MLPAARFPLTKTVSLPPNSDWMPPAKFPRALRERTVMPRTMPIWRTTVWPGISLVVETSMGSPFQVRNMKTDRRSGKTKAAGAASRPPAFRGAAIVTLQDSATTTR
jgi:hypothetical protein